MMKLTILFFLHISSPVYAKEIPQDTMDSFSAVIAPYLEECQKTSNADVEIVSKWLSNAEVADDYGFKRYLLCIYKKVGFYDKNGTVDVKVLEDLVSNTPGGNLEMVSNCMKKIIGVEDPLERVYNLEVCFSNEFSV